MKASLCSGSSCSRAPKSTAAARLLRRGSRYWASQWRPSSRTLSISRRRLHDDPPPSSVTHWACSVFKWQSWRSPRRYSAKSNCPGFMARLGVSNWAKTRNRSPARTSLTIPSTHSSTRPDAPRHSLPSRMPAISTSSRVRSPTLKVRMGLGLRGAGTVRAGPHAPRPPGRLAAAGPGRNGPGHHGRRDTSGNGARPPRWRPRRATAPRPRGVAIAAATAPATPPTPQRPSPSKPRWGSTPGDRYRYPPRPPAPRSPAAGRAGQGGGPVPHHFLRSAATCRAFSHGEVSPPRGVGGKDEG